MDEIQENAHLPWGHLDKLKKRVAKESDDVKLVARMYGDAIARKHFDSAQTLIERICVALSTAPVEDFDECWLPFLRELKLVLPDVSQSFTEPPIRSVFCGILTAYLGRVVGLKPQPTDWKRARSDCSCRDCTDLNGFLVDPMRQVGRFPMSQQRRRHLHQKLDRIRGQSNLTERTGSPQTLVVTKNLEHWKEDLDAWGRRAYQAKQVFIYDLGEKILKEALAEKYDDIMEMRMIQVPTTLATVPNFNTSAQLRNPVYGQPCLAEGQVSLPPLRETSDPQRNLQRLPGVNWLPGAENQSGISRKRKADVIDLTDD